MQICSTDTISTYGIYERQEMRIQLQNTSYFLLIFSYVICAKDEGSLTPSASG